MAYTTTQTFDTTPNSGIPFEVATSYNSEQLDLTAGEAGYGSFLNRSIATQLTYYYATKFPFDQMSQLFGDMEATATGVYEWFQAEALFDFEAAGVTENATDVINNTDGANTYVPATTNRFVVAASDINIFLPYSEVRYETATGWAHAYVLSIADAAAEKELNLTSIDGSNLPVAASNTAKIQHIATNLPQDLDYDESPRQSDPTGYKTYTENYRKEIKMSRKEVDINRNGGTVLDLISHYEKQLAENFRRDRETKNLLGSGAKTRKQIDSDVVNFSNGIYNQVRDENLHTSDLKTTSVFDADKFKSAMNSFMLYNFGAEGGGPQAKDFYVDPNMQSYFDEAWESQERFLGGNVSTEFVAGVSVTSIEKTQGRLDTMVVPNWALMHPLKDAQIRGGSAPKGVGLLLPMDEDHVCRVLQEGFGPRQEVYKKQGGDRLMFQRMESIEGLAIKNIQHAAVFEEIAE